LGGTADREHSGVVAVAIRSIPQSLCTGTLIADNLVLTARHCVSNGPREVICNEGQFDPPFEASELVIATEAQLTEQTPWYETAELRVPDSNALCGVDVALLLLASRIPPHLAKAIIPRIDLPVTRGDRYSAVGFGLQGTTQGTGGARRIRSDLSVTCTPGACGSLLTSSEFSGGGGPCWGDSGGPALDPEGRVFGIASRGALDCSATIYSAVAAWREMLREAALRAAKITLSSPPDWAISGSSSNPDAGVDDSPIPAEPIPTNGPTELPEPSPLPVSETGQAGSTCRAVNDCAEGLRCVATVCTLAKSDAVPPTCQAARAGSPNAAAHALLFALPLLVLGCLRRQTKALA
jgi:hypothetical protein